ncbi:MAG TPA: FlgD immunoglobulin-like domain containing protein, partial [Bacteroidota bacterium]|nr:FlgD immunoglobulin-like domain containing protein [Bacteroidota bacterium]
NAQDPAEKSGISFTADSGATWKTGLLNEFVHAVGFNGTIAYAATDNGIFRSADLGASWSSTGTIYDAGSKQRMTTTQFYAVASRGTTSWFGSSDGIACTTDNGSAPFGSSWTILRASRPLASTTDTYAYPNPFSPNDEVVRIHYSSSGTGSTVSGTNSSVTIRIFDFGMNLVRTLVQSAPRLTRHEFDEIWDGRDDNRNQVANGVYFYQVIVNNSDPAWGKILVLE